MRGSGENLAGLMTVSLNILSWSIGENELAISALKHAEISHT
jgi:hypothetical protein